MRHHLRRAILGPVLLLTIALGACAPAAGDSAASAYDVGSVGYVSYGTILAMQPVRVAGTRTGIGAGTGVVGGSLIGGTIGGDWRARAVGTVAGAVIGGITGAAVEEGVTSGHAIRYLVREDYGPDIEIIQTNEPGFQPGDRVAISRGNRVRLARADHVPPPAPVRGGRVPRK